MDIVSKMRDEIIKRSNEFEAKTKGTKDEYNIYNEIKDEFKYLVKDKYDKVMNSDDII